MTEQIVTLETHDAGSPEMDAFVVTPDGTGPFPAMVVVQEAFGVNPHIQDVCRRLARAGYVAVAPEIFHRTGRGVLIDYGDMAKVMPHFAALTNDGITGDLNAALAWLRGKPEVQPRRVGVIGFCVGGFGALLAACRTDVAATVAFYPGGVVQGRPGLAITPVLGEMDGVRAPVLAIFGGADHSIPPEHVETVRDRFSKLDPRHEVAVYAEAGHGFHCDDRPAFRPAAAAAAWQKTIEFLARYV